MRHCKDKERKELSRSVDFFPSSVLRRGKNIFVPLSRDAERNIVCRLAKKCNANFVRIISYFIWEGGGAAVVVQFIATRAIFFCFIAVLVSASNEPVKTYFLLWRRRFFFVCNLLFGRAGAYYITPAFQIGHTSVQYIFGTYYCIWVHSRYKLLYKFTWKNTYNFDDKESSDKSRKILLRILNQSFFIGKQSNLFSSST